MMQPTVPQRAYVQHPVVPMPTPSATERNLDAPDGGATFVDQPMGPGKLRPPVAVNVNVQ